MMPPPPFSSRCPGVVVVRSEPPMGYSCPPVWNLLDPFVTTLHITARLLVR